MDARHDARHGPSDGPRFLRASLSKRTLLGTLQRDGATERTVRGRALWWLAQGLRFDERRENPRRRQNGVEPNDEIRQRWTERRRRVSSHPRIARCATVNQFFDRELLRCERGLGPRVELVCGPPAQTARQIHVLRLGR